MVIGSLLGQIFSPIFHAMSWLLAFYYGIVPNYVVAIMLLTFTVMILSFPLNRAATRSMFKMQLLAPEMQKIRNKYKVGRDTPALERQQLRQKMNEETMALYRDNNVSMLGGCLPNLAVFPIFIVLYDVVRGLTSTCLAPVGTTTPGVCASAAVAKAGKHLIINWAPRYDFYQNTALYRNLSAHNGQMKAFGINLANTVRTPQAHWYLVLPFVAIVLVAIALQYLQLKQMTSRNTSTAPAAQQMQTMQRVMPIVMAFIYISIPAGVVVYFVASSLFRISQQEWMYRRDPHITKALAELKARQKSGASGAGAKGSSGRGTTSSEPAPVSKQGGERRPSFRERLALAIAPAEDTTDAEPQGTAPRSRPTGAATANGKGASQGARSGGGTRPSQPGGQKRTDRPATKAQPTKAQPSKAQPSKAQPDKTQPAKTPQGKAQPAKGAQTRGSEGATPAGTKRDPLPSGSAQRRRQRRG